ncbi:MFS transporter [Alpinimonas psychrophila]|uniref:CP family cyanate transporter-like MFS transporter n=1 Tax=Alpinimonas psychrophila TaxID=748908 RepID=A0A7W3PMK2_9MICO|nr:CP family cyanate transporter-like MFS transporter [Alpinimonas psychrophila]
MNIVASPSRSLFRGRAVTFAGIFLVAAGLRSAVTSVSPIMASIEKDVTFTPLTIGLLGMMAPLTFAVVGTLTPLVARRIGLEWTMVAAALFIGLGQILRATAIETTGFLGWSIATMAGIGAANVLLPPLVKRFFPDRISTMSSIYLVVAVASSIVPPYFASPLEQATDWRISIGSWGLIAILAVLPWLGTIYTERGTDLTYEVTHAPGIARRVWTSPTSWAMTLGFAVAAFQTYVMFAWLPAMLQERLGMSAAETGVMLAVYAAITLPMGFFIPRLVARLQSLFTLFALASGFFVIGNLGLWLFPGVATVLWVVITGAGPMLFSITLVMIAFRTTTQAGAVVLSGMVQGVGYALGALGPLLVGIMHGVSNDWTSEYLLIVGVGLLPLISGFILRRKYFADAPRNQADDSSIPV